MENALNREQRRPYLEVIGLIDGGTLCTICRFSDYVGGGSSPCMGEGWCECKHRVTELSWQHIHEENLPPGSDCWGFRPGFPMPVIADIVGMILAGGWEHWGITYFPNDGRIVVGGWSGDTPPPRPVNIDQLTTDQRIDTTMHLRDCGAGFGV